MKRHTIIVILIFVLFALTIKGQQIKTVVLENNFPTLYNGTGCQVTLSLLIESSLGVGGIVSPTINNILIVSNTTKYIYNIDIFSEYGAISPLIRIKDKEGIISLLNIPTLSYKCVELSRFEIKLKSLKPILLDNINLTNKYRVLFEISNLPKNTVNSNFKIQKLAPAFNDWTLGTTIARVKDNVFSLDLTFLLTTPDISVSGGIEILTPTNIVSNITIPFDSFGTILEPLPSILALDPIPSQLVVSRTKNFQFFTNLSYPNKFVASMSPLSPVLYKGAGTPNNCTLVGVYSFSTATSANLFLKSSYGTKSFASQSLSFPTSYDAININSATNNIVWPTQYIQLRSIYSASILPTRNIVLSYTNYPNLVLEYPYGVCGLLPKTGVDIKVSLCVSKLLSKYIKFIDETISYEQLQPKSNNIPNTLPLVDSSPPTLLSIEFKSYQSNKLYVKAIITDDVSGFSQMTFGNAFKILPKDLVSGNLLNGVYEAIVDFQPYQITTIDLVDIAQNVMVYNTDSILNTETLQQIPSIPFNQYVYANNITYFRFEKNDVDVGQSSVENKLFLNFTNANTDQLVYFRPYFFFNYPYMQNPSWLNTTFVGSWNSTLGLFVIDFVIPARLFTGTYTYEINIAGRITHVAAISFLGTEAELRVVSPQDSDMIPPLIKSLTYVSGSNDEFGWLIQITDKSGFKKGRVHVLSSIDPKEYVFEISGEQIATGTIYNGQYPIMITANQTTCIPQSYNITRVVLYDQQNTISSNFGYTDSYFDPTSQVATSSFLKMTPPCSRANYHGGDITPPTITLLSSSIDSKTEIDVGDSTQRNVEFSLSVQDLESGISPRHIPVVYILNEFGEILESTFTIVSFYNTTAQYKTSITIPYGWGFGGRVSYSVYGIVDNQLNFAVGGLKSKQDPEFTNQFSTVFNTKKYPVIEGSSTITSRGGLLQVYGRNFGTDSQQNITTIYVDYQDGFGFQNIQKPTFLNNVVFIVNSIRATINPFYIKVVVDGLPSNIYTVTPIYQQTPSDDYGTCPGTPTACFGNGDCVNGKCVCKNSFSGIDCSSTLVPITQPPANNTSPDRNPTFDTEVDGKKITFSSLISIVLLREKNFNGQVIQEYSFKDWSLTNITDKGVTQYLYKTSLTHPQTNLVTNINTTVTWFSQAKNISFGGQIIEMKPSSLKYNVDLSSYSFSSQLNYLELIMSAKLSSTLEDFCSLNQFFNDSSIGTSGNSINDNQYLTVQVNDIILQGRFLKRAIVDDYIVTIQNNQIPTNNSQSTESLVGINIPFYKRTVSIDPDFSVLIAEKSAKKDEKSVCFAKEDNKSSKLNGAQIAGIVVGGVVFVFIIAAFIIYKLSTRGSSKMALKLKKLVASRT
ncbi:hypothetical protein CYY_007800 [Polysphondylium violaceum]|uniref:EGF-like domain-containing protein n=1 Tax=Polysphondylium violaceum TaxID=133409 RepID=A0A8J4PPR5_9MYCE|nr:hypothetical protein CYY_007800 [Polysphondylium violaceum]